MTEHITITDEQTVSATSLALLFDLSIRRVQQLAQDGTLPTISRGKFNLVDCVRRFIQSKDKQTDEDEKYDRAQKIASTQMKASKAAMLKMQAEEMKGRMHRSEDVEAMMVDFASAVRSALIALPGRLAVDVSGVSPAEASDIIRKEVYKVLETLSEYTYKPEKFETLVRERNKWEPKLEDTDEI